MVRSSGAPVVRFDAVIDPTEQNEFYQRGSFNDLHFAPGGIIYAANSDQCVYQFLVEPAARLRRYFFAYRGAASSVALHPDGEHLYSGFAAYIAR
ncbi:MAG: hypothetical protein OSB21_02235 [Myxococcota bacterium]|nr:hypothetical protein [Myxococcota bacterium]